MFWQLVLIVVAAEAAAVYYLKKYSTTSNVYFFLISMLLYTLYAFSLGKLFTKKKIAVSQAITGMLSLILLAILGAFLHNEVLGYKEIMGLSVAVFAIFILI